MFLKCFLKCPRTYTNKTKNSNKTNNNLRVGKLLIFFNTGLKWFYKNVHFPKPMIQDPLYDKKNFLNTKPPLKIF